MIGDELSPLPLDVFDVAAMPSGLSLAVARRKAEHLDEPWLKRCHALGVELDYVDVVLGDEVVDPVRREVRKLARASVVAGGTDEIVVLAAMAAGAFRELEAAGADAAEHRALQVVLVLPLVLAGDRAGGEDLLNPVKHFWADEPRVGSLVFDSAVRNDPDVVAIPQDLLERRNTDCCAVRVPSGRAASQSALVELLDE